MKKAAIYARFSTDLQKETSIDDQVRLGREKAKQLFLHVAAVYHDAATKGSSPVATRPGGKRLLEDAMAGRFRVLIIEGLDRLSRDSVDQEVVVRRLEHRGIRIIGIADGYDSESSVRKLARGMRGLINEAYLDDLRHKTHRGLTGQVARGFHAGGLSYGYKSFAVGLNSKGDAEGFRLEVDEDKAKIVRRIFDEFGDGRSCQHIAHTLNKEGVPGPRGTWSVSALYGSPDKGAGVLNNELYIGKYIWNRSKWVRDPDSHKRVRLVRPREEWVEEDRPELRIVTDEQWQKVRDRMQSTRGRAKPRNNRRSTLLGGLVRCGICGGSIIAINKTQYGCVTHKDRGSTVCSGVTVSRKRLETRIVQYLLNTLSDINIERIKHTVPQFLRDKQRETEAENARREAQRKDLEAQIANITNAIAKRGDSEDLLDALDRLTNQKKLVGDVQPIRTFDPVAFERAVRVTRANLQADDSALQRLALTGLLAGSTLIKAHLATSIELRPHLNDIPLISLFGIRLPLDQEFQAVVAVA